MLFTINKTSILVTKLLTVRIIVMVIHVPNPLRLNHRLSLPYRARQNSMSMSCSQMSRVPQLRCFDLRSVFLFISLVVFSLCAGLVFFIICHYSFAFSAFCLAYQTVSLSVAYFSFFLFLLSRNDNDMHHEEILTCAFEGSTRSSSCGPQSS